MLYSRLAVTLVLRQPSHVRMKLEPGPEPPLGPRPDQTAWFQAVSIAVAIVICLIAFTWLFLRLDPYMTDFVSSDAESSVPVV